MFISEELREVELWFSIEMSSTGGNWPEFIFVDHG
jgi:hypothetical protein